MRQVPRQIKSVPSRSEPTKRSAIDVRHSHQHFSARREQTMNFAQYFQGLMHVL